MRFRFYCFFLLSCWLILANVKAQLPTSKQQDSIRKIIGAQLGPAAARLDLVKFNTLVVVEQDTFFNPGGFNYLFLLQNGEVKRVDQCYFHGTTFNRYLFGYKDIIYQLGGYGLFATNNHLLRFSFMSKEWEMVKTTGEKPGFIQGITFMRNDSLISFNNRKGGNGVEADTVNPDVYLLNLKTFNWKRLGVKSKLNGFSLNYETPDYLFCVNGNRFLLLNKQKLAFEIIENLGESFLKNTAARNEENKLYFEPLLNSNSSEEPTLSLDSLWQANVSRAEVFRLTEDESNVKVKRDFRYYLAGLLLLGAIAGAGFWFKKRSAVTPVLLAAGPPLDQESLSSQYYRSLMASEQAVLTMEELDQLLGIDYMEADSRKLRRHRLLQELQEDYPGVITRIKDEKDRRRFLYRVRKDA